MTPAGPRWATVLLVLALLLVGCGSSGPLAWRDLTLELPEGWLVLEDRDTVLTVADGAAGEEAGDRGRQRVAMQFAVVTGTSPQDWRDLVRDEGGTLEEDRPMQLTGAAATQLVWTWVTNGIPTREMIVVVPSRQLEILAQPVVLAGESNGPEVFVANRDLFEQVLASIVFGAPVQSHAGQGVVSTPTADRAATSSR